MIYWVFSLIASSLAMTGISVIYALFNTFIGSMFCNGRMPLLLFLSMTVSDKMTGFKRGLNITLLTYLQLFCVNNTQIMRQIEFLA